MDFNAITGNQSTTAQSGKSGTAGPISDYNSFLNLFVTQLKYQDPLSPQSQEDFLAQTAQFSSVEQLMNLNQKISDFSALSRATAASLIGRKVEGTVTDTNGVEKQVGGLVSQVDYGTDGSLILGLQDGTTLPFSDIDSIAQA